MHRPGQWLDAGKTRRAERLRSVAGGAEHRFRRIGAHAGFKTIRRITLGGQRVIVGLGAEVAVVQAQDVQAVIARGVRIFTQPPAGFAASPEPDAWHARQSISLETGSTTSVVASTVPPVVFAVRRISG